MEKPWLGDERGLALCCRTSPAHSFDPSVVLPLSRATGERTFSHSCSFGHARCLSQTLRCPLPTAGRCRWRAPQDRYRPAETLTTAMPTGYHRCVAQDNRDSADLRSKARGPMVTAGASWSRTAGRIWSPRTGDMVGIEPLHCGCDHSGLCSHRAREEDRRHALLDPDPCSRRRSVCCKPPSIRSGALCIFAPRPLAGS